MPTPPENPVQVPGAAPLVRVGAGADPPPIPASRGPMPRWLFRFFPKLENDADHPKAWTFPPYLDNPGCRWLGVLKELYASPMAFPASISPEAGLMLFSLVRNIRPRTVVEVGTFIGISTIWIAAALEEAAGDPGGAGAAGGAGAGGGEGKPGGIIHAFDDLGPMGKGPWREAELTGSREPVVQESLRRAGLEHRVVLHPGDSSVEIRKMRDALRGGLDALAAPWGGAYVGSEGGAGGVDLALIDGNHTTEGVLQDLWAVEPVLNTGGYILLHDTFPEQCGQHHGPRYILDHIASVAQGVYEVCELYTAPLNYGMALLRRIG